MIFSTTPGDTTPIAVSLNLSLEGLFSPVVALNGSNMLALGPAYIRGTIRSGNVVNARGNLVEAGKVSTLNFETGLGGVVDGAGPVSGILSQTFLVLPNATRRLEITLMTEANGFLLNGVIYGSAADASNSLRFNPTSVFDVPDGVTVSSASWGLMDNQLPYLIDTGVVPLPAGLPLLIAAFGLLGLLRRTRD